MRALKAVVALTIGLAASSTWAAIYDVGTLTGGTSSNVNAISQNGAYVAGWSTDSTGFKQPVLWSVSTGLVQLPNPSGGDSDARGVDVWARTAGTEIWVAGSVGNIQRWYHAPIGSLGSSSWSTISGASGGSNIVAGQFNTARVDASNRAVDVGSAATGTSANRGYRSRLDGTTLVEGIADYRNTGTVKVNSVRGDGVPVGYDSGNPSSARRAIVMTSASGTVQTVIPGGAGVRSEANGASGTGTFVVGQDYDGPVANGIYQAFRWSGSGNMTLLGRLAGDTGSWAFGVSSSGLAGGMSFNAANAVTGERAVIWDPTGAWDATASNSPMLLTDVLTAKGINWSGWQFLTRITSISNDGSTIAGWGYTTAGETHGFVVTVPEPTTIGLLAIGSLLMVRRRRGVA